MQNIIVTLCFEVPSRLDLAKKRYGGPFTTEEVENVKTFGRILLVLISLFGFLFLPYFVTSCCLYLLFANYFRLHLALFHKHPIYLPLLLIPIHMLIIRPCFNRYYEVLNEIIYHYRNDKY